MNKKFKDYNVNNEGMLYPVPKKTDKVARKSESEKLVRQIAIWVTQAEFDKINKKCQEAEFPSISSFMRVKLRREKII